jgi:predicted Zn-dependent protease
MSMGLNAVLGVTLAGLLSALAGCAVNPVSGQSDFMLMSQEQEISLGREEHPNILKQYGKYGHVELQAYVEMVGQRLAAVSHRSDLSYHFTLLDSPEVNAFALPGGYVYITRGLLSYLNSEAEMAAVLGHEIGHVTARHGARQYSAAMATGLGVTLGSILVPELRQQSAQDLLNVLGTALLRGYGREHELEADRLGAEYLARSGYDPQAMIQVIRVLKNQEQFELQLAREENREPRIYHGVFSTHPDNDQRLHEVVGAAGKVPPAGAVRTVERGPFLARLQGLIFGPGAHEGVVRGQEFYHRDLDIGARYPAGWRVDNLSDRILATAPQQAAMLQTEVEVLKQALAPEPYLAQRFKGGTLTDGAALSGQPLPGYSARILLNTALGRREARVIAVARGLQMYLFIGVTHDADAGSRFDGDFLATARSLHALTTAERELAEPLRLAVIKAAAGATFSQLAGDSRIPHHAEEQLRLLNDRYPQGEPQAGEAIKVVR